MEGFKVFALTRIWHHLDANCYFSPPSVATGSTVGKLTPESMRSSWEEKESWNLAKGEIQAQVSSHLSHTVPNSEETEEKKNLLFQSISLW